MSAVTNCYQHGSQHTKQLSRCADATSPGAWVYSAGVKAVVDALLLMYHLASTVEAPRKRRSVLCLVLLWLVLLLACIWWIYGRR